MTFSFDHMTDENREYSLSQWSKTPADKFCNWLSLKFLQKEFNAQRQMH